MRAESDNRPRRIAPALYQGVVTAAAIGACAAWTFRPLPNDEEIVCEPPVVAASGSGSTQAQAAAVDTTVFRAPLWVARPPEPPPVAAAPPPAPPPLRLQLLAIVQDGETLQAVLYDQDADTIVIARPGDEVRGARVEQVTQEGLVVRVGEVARSITLRAAGSGGGA